ncbi:MAG: hypothetical protein JXR97_01360 [Planctomycetes bacterium]|nr:hypothetical protein [Planctomycetota bacterium]
MTEYRGNVIALVPARQQKRAQLPPKNTGNLLLNRDLRVIEVKLVKLLPQHFIIFRVVFQKNGGLIFRITGHIGAVSGQNSSFFRSFDAQAPLIALHTVLVYITLIVIQVQVAARHVGYKDKATIENKLLVTTGAATATEIFQFLLHSTTFRMGQTGILSRKMEKASAALFKISAHPVFFPFKFQGITVKLNTSDNLRM